MKVCGIFVDDEPDNTFTPHGGTLYAPFPDVDTWRLIGLPLLPSEAYIRGTRQLPIALFGFSLFARKNHPLGKKDTLPQ